MLLFSFYGKRHFFSKSHYYYINANTPEDAEADLEKAYGHFYKLTYDGVCA